MNLKELLLCGLLLMLGVVIGYRSNVPGTPVPNAFTCVNSLAPAMYGAVDETIALEITDREVVSDDERLKYARRTGDLCWTFHMSNAEQAASNSGDSETYVQAH